MVKFKKFMGSITLFAFISAPLYGGVLAQCLLQHSPKDKRETLVKWIVATYAQEPMFKGLVAVNKSQYQKVENEAVNFLSQLLRTCSPQMMQVMATQGLKGVESEMNLYGQGIAQSLSSPLLQKKVNLLGQKITQMFFAPGRGNGATPLVNPFK
ncbi:MAG: hypothetical protein C6I01_02575 [Epsilonproteobacteria bacterium]|jgi:hypothetical protein|nr:hypothetical protein [Campylobacterota bacterium]NPA88899.1 hypothetical protein [Campylobacterota bacterium]